MFKRAHLRPERYFARFFKGGTKKQDRPTLFLELFFDVVVAVVLGGISTKTKLWLSVLDPGTLQDAGGAFSAEQLTQITDVAHKLLAFYCLELVTTMLVWRAVTNHMLRYRDSIHLRLAVFSIMLPFLLTAASCYLAGTPEEFGESDFNFFFRINVYAYSATTLIVGSIYSFHALGNVGIERRYNMYMGVPMLAVGSVIIPLVSGLLTSFTIADAEFWSSLLTIMGVQLGIILWGQRIASKKKYGWLLHVKIENLKDRYNSLFLLFMGEFVITVIEGWVEGGPEKPGNIAVLIMSLALPLFAWWRYTNYLDYLDIKRTHNSLLAFSAMMLLSICFLIFVADGLAMWMEGAERIGTITFAACSVLSFVTSTVLWNSFKRYKESTRFVMPRWALVTGGIALFLSDAISLVLALTLTTEIIPNEVCILAGSVAYVALNSIVFYMNTTHPHSAREFEVLKKPFKYTEEKALMEKED